MCDNSLYDLSNIPICSNHGICISNNCFCNEGWTGLSRYHIETGLDCDINIFSMKIISGFNLILSICILFVSIILFFIKILPRGFHLKSQGKTIISFVLAIFGIFLISLARFNDPKTGFIGKSIIASIGYIITLNSLSFGFLMLIIRLIKYLKGYSRLMSINYRILLSNNKFSFSLFYQNISIILPIISIILSIISVLPYKYSNINLIVFRSIEYIIAIAIIIFSLFTIYYINVFQKQLKEYLRHLTDTYHSPNFHDLKNVLKSIQSIKQILYIYCIIFGFISLIFNSIKYLNHKFDYYFNIELLLYQLFSLIIIISLFSVKYSINSIRPVTEHSVGGHSSHLEQSKMSLFKLSTLRKASTNTHERYIVKTSIFMPNSTSITRK